MPDNFDQWNFLKKQLHERKKFPFGRPREIWWCSVGTNIGVETNGKHDNFERPVLILRAYNAEMLKIVPLTTKIKTDKFHHKVSNDYESYAMISQIRVISGKRLLRKIGTISQVEFKNLKQALEKLG